MKTHIDRLLIFDIRGTMAHFRKFYTNSSSLSYPFPPRTTIAGLIAGMLGIERDKYYEKFSCEKCKIGVSVRVPIRKIMQTVNYIRTKSLGEINLSAGPTQIPLEIVLPLEDNEQLNYRIYFYHVTELFDELRKILETKKFVYPPYLGMSEFIAEIRFIDSIEDEEIELLSNPSEPVEIVTPINAKQIQEGGVIFEHSSGKILQYIKERMPIEFTLGRRIKKVGGFIYEKNNNIAKLKIKDNYYRIEYQDPEGGKITENIVFMES